MPLKVPNAADAGLELAEKLHDLGLLPDLSTVLAFTVEFDARRQPVIRVTVKPTVEAIQVIGDHLPEMAPVVIEEVAAG